MTMSVPNISSKKRLLFIFTVVSVVMFGLIIRLGWIQLVHGERYKELANSQQTRDIPIPAKRGIIHDRNGKKLAISASSNTVWVRPSEVQDADETADALARILELDEEETYEKISDKRYGLVRIARWIEDDLADLIRQERMRGVWIAEDNRRYYPYGNFASYILGHTTNDNRGMSGIELEYDKYLSGLPGRWIKNTDGRGRQLPFSSERYFPAEDGLSLVLTVDEVIQHFAEKAIENALEANKAERVKAIVMDVKSGDILAMAVKPDYDPNEPRVPLDEELRMELDLMKDEEKLDAWFKMWRNPLINDTYEPGSTFKIVTTSAALELGVATPESTYYSKGYIMVGGRQIKSWRWYNPFGHQTLAEAVANSDNPVFVELVQKMGAQDFYRYIESFGFAETTGIDLPGERNSLMYNINAAGPVELATMSFGQSISITPIQLITGVSAVANNGNLMTPKIVKELVDSKGNIIHRFEDNVVRQVISEKTAKQMVDILESVVSEASNAYIPGYRVAGKTGTAQKVIDGRYASGKYISSFVGFAPADDPEIAVLVIVDEPNGYSHFGGVVAAPVAREIFEESLNYLDIRPKYTETDELTYSRQEVVIPDVRDLSIKEASKILVDSNLDFKTGPEFTGDENAVVVDMFPKPGAKVQEQSTVILYIKNNSEIPSSVIVPDLTGRTIREVDVILNNLGLKLKMNGNGFAINQSPLAGIEVDPGTIVDVEFNSDINGNRN